LRQSDIIPGVPAVSPMSNFTAVASAFLIGKGWQEVYNRAGGMNAWVGNGMPVAAPG
jgi:rhodanese-related sulfurtransferase